VVRLVNRNSLNSYSDRLDGAGLHGIELSSISIDKSKELSVLLLAEVDSTQIWIKNPLSSGCFGFGACTVFGFHRKKGGKTLDFFFHLS
jgi:hypothetical protein